MNLGIIASQILVSGGTPTPLVANAGGNKTVSRFSPVTVLNSSASTGNITSRTWSFISKSIPTDAHYQVDENGHVMNPTGIATPIFGLEYRPASTYNGIVCGSGEYKYRLTVSNGVTTATDDVTVTVTYDNLPPQKTNWRYLTSGDYASVPNGAIGDFYIDGANDGFYVGGMFTDIYIGTGYGLTLGPGNKVLIKAGQYGNIAIYAQDGLCVGSAGNPIIITNSGGQVEMQRGMVLNNFRYAKLTGKYVAGVSGHASYLGHDAGYAFSRGKYGIFANNCWSNLSSASIYITGQDASHTTVEYIEAGNGGFAGIFFKSDDHTAANYYNCTVQNTYVHDTGGEGHYIGSSSNSNPQQLYNFTFKNNRVARSGNEGIQIGKLADGAVINNNVSFMGAARWKSPFNDTQCFNLQLGFTNGGSQAQNNIIIGAGEQLLSMFSQYQSGITETGTDIIINNNVFFGSKGFIAGYIADDGNGDTPVRHIQLNNNFQGLHNFLQDKVYISPYSHAINTQQNFRIPLVTNTLSMDSLFRDNSKTQDQFGQGIVTNTIVGVPADIDFNAGFDKTYYTNYSVWSTLIYQSYGDEFQAYDGTIRIGSPSIYNTGDLVFWHSKFYTSNIDNNFAIMPMGVTDSFWTKLTWTDGVTTYDYPPDDFTLATSSFYGQRSIGLVDTKVSTDADAQAFITAAGLTTTSDKNAITTLVSDLKGYGVWSKLKAIYPFAANTASSHKWNLKDPRDLDAAFRLNFVGSWTHANSGATPSSTYADTFFVPSVNSTSSLMSMGFHSATDTADGTKSDMGAISSSTLRTQIYPKFGNTFYCQINTDNAISENTSNTNSIGWFFGSRTSSSQTFFQKDLTQFDGLTTAGSPAVSVYLGAQNVAGTASYNADRCINFAVLGDSLTKTEGQNLYSAITAYFGNLTSTPVTPTPPSVNAGSNQTITLPTNSVTLTGSLISGGTIVTKVWTKDSGPSCTIVTPNSYSTNVTGMTNGVYVFRLTLTDNTSQVGYSTVQVNVNLANTSGNTLTNVGGWNAYVHLPDDYSSNSTTYYPTIVAFPGLGEIGTNANDLLKYGPSAYIQQGWNGNVVNDGVTIKFIVISIQPPSAYPPVSSVSPKLDILRSTYRIDTTKLNLTGLSMGGWCAKMYVTADPLGGPYTYASQINCVVDVEGVISDDNSPYPTRFDNFAYAGGRYLGFEQAQDYRGIPAIATEMNSKVANSAIAISTNYGNGGHGYFELFYGGLTPGTSTTNEPAIFTLNGRNENIYNWMARQ